MEAEIWEPYPNSNGRYLVSNMGRVKSLYRESKYGKITPTNYILTPYLDDAGYLRLRISTRRNGVLVQKSKKVHRLVAETFIPNPLNKPTVNHKDLDKTNNKLSNLEWATHLENTTHAHEGGAVPKRLKFSDSQANEILNMIRLVGVTHTALRLGERYSTIKSVAVRYNLKLERETGKIILDTKTGVFYNGAPELSDLIGIKRKEIVRMLNGERPNKTSYIYV